MTIRMWEKFKSRSGNGESVELGYVVQGTDNDLEVRLHVAGNTPQIYNLNLRRGEISIAPIGIELWEATVPYERPDKKQNKPRDAGSQPKFSFDTTGGRQNVKHSEKTVDIAAADGGEGFSFDPDRSTSKPPEDFKGLIGVNGDEVEGVDLVVPTFRFQETHYYPFIPFEYAQRLYRLTGRVNKDRFRDFDPGEVLFLGAQGGQERGKPAEITFFFDCSPNVTNLTIGDITVKEKAGWDYLWVHWHDVLDDEAFAIVKRPKAAYVEQVYPRANFVELNFVFGASASKKPESTDVRPPEVPDVEVPAAAGEPGGFFPGGDPGDAFPL